MGATGYQNLPPCGDEFVRTLQLVPELGANDSRDDRECDDVQRVRVDAVALEVVVQNDRGTDGREPKQQAEGSNVPGAKVDVRKHADFSISAECAFTSRDEVTVRGCGRLFLIAAIRYPTHNHVFA